MTRSGEFRAGARASIPLLVGALPFGLIFGAVATAGGIPPIATIAFSAILFAGSAQFIAIKLLAAGAGTLVVILTIAVVNLRHALYGLALGPRLHHLPQRWLVMLGFLMTDEAFVATARRFENGHVRPHGHWFFFGAGLSMYLVWNAATIVGIVAGQRIPDPSRWGLEFALDITFLGMLFPLLARRPMLLAALVAGLVALLARHLPNQLGLIVAAVAGVCAGVLAETRWPPAAPAQTVAPDSAP